jgi:mono/diheme cytochrome c family protein
MRWLIVALFTTAAAFAAGQTPTLPDGEGKALVQGACVNCHGLDLVTGKTATKDEWSSLVDRMKSYGTNIDDKQTATVIDYLAKAFPPKGAAAPAAAAGGQDPDAAGKALVNGACASCHGADLITGKNATRKEWSDVIDRMKGYGASLSGAQTTTLLDYLEKTQGPKQQAANTDAAAKALLEASCTGCHDLDLVSNRTGNQAEWQEVVDRMNGRGAGVAEKDVPVLVQYLVKTYPKK